VQRVTRKPFDVSVATCIRATHYEIIQKNFNLKLISHLHDHDSALREQKLTRHNVLITNVYRRIFNFRDFNYFMDNNKLSIINFESLFRNFSNRNSTIFSTRIRRQCTVIIFPYVGRIMVLRYVRYTAEYAFEEMEISFLCSSLATAETNYIGERRNFFLHGQASVPRGRY